MKMRWDDVRVFLELARHENMHRAARALGVNASTLSRRLRTLEDGLDQELFARRPEGLVLTEAGREVWPHALEVEAAFGRFEGTAADWEREVRGVVKIGAAPAMVEHLVTPWLMDALEAHPDLELDVRVDHEVADVLRREVDVAIRKARPDHVELFARKLGTLDYVTAASSELASTVGILSDLSQAPWVGWPEPMSHLSLASWYADAGVHPRVRIGLYAAQLELAAKGAGLVLCPRRLLPVHRLVEVPWDDALTARLASPPRSDFWLVTHQSLRRVPRVATVWERIVAHADAYSARLQALHTNEEP